MSKKTLLLLITLFLIAFAAGVNRRDLSKPMLTTDVDPISSSRVSKPQTLKADLEKAETDASLWNPDTQITNNSLLNYTEYFNQRHIVVELSGRVHVVWSTSTSPYNIFYKRYTPGFGWSNDTMIHGSGQTYNRYPSIALDSTGMLHVVYMAGTSTSAYYRVYYKSCTPVGTGNGGWNADTLLSNTLTTNYKYYPNVAYSPDGHVHAIWREYNSTTPYYYRIAYLEKIAGVWQAQVNLDSSPTTTPYHYQYYPMVAAGRDGNVHICKYDYDAANPSYYQIFYIGRYSGVWTALENVSNSFGIYQYYPTIAVNNLTNEPHILWRAYPSPYYFVHSRRTSGVWTIPDTVCGYPGTTLYQYYCQLGHGPGGKMHAVWYGYTPTSTSIYQISYRERSAAGSWSSPIQISNTTTYAYYPSIAVNDSDYAHVVWRDNRSGAYELWYAKGNPPFPNDMAVDAIVVPGAAVLPNANFTPVIRIKNAGSLPQSNIPVTVRIDTSGVQVYNQTANYVGILNAGDTGSVTMPTSYTVGSSKLVTYVVTAFTSLVGDQNPANDTIIKNVGVSYPPNTFFAFEWATPTLTTTGGVYGCTHVQDTLVWIARGYTSPFQVLIFNINTMSLVDSFAQYYPTGSYGYRDMTYDPDSDFVYAGMENNTLHKINATTHALVAPYTVTGSYTPTVVRALVHDGDSLICCNFSGNICKFATDGTNSHSLGVTGNSTYGLGLDKTNLRMYGTEAYSSTAPNHIQEWDLPSWAYWDSIIPWCGGGPELFGGCETFRNDTFLLVALQSVGDGNKVVCIRLIPLANDVGVASILAPSGVISAGAQTPQALIKNYGSQANSFDVMMTIEPGGYADTVTVTGLAGDDTITVSFASWTPGSGFYTVSCSTMLAIDENNSNDAQSAMAALADYIEQFEGQDGGFTPDPA
ncbi:MAG: hypothetical protein OEZ20_00895, partial [candidate division WOR-3 bacterium]|nr:hypothetical protein [candidate division WOR-3 bacterium]